jgi:CheY-like chemotaxis protein
MSSAASHDQHAASDLQRSSAVVMVVDSDPFVRELAGHFLSQAGYTVEYALDGYEALDRIRKVAPAVLLVDIVVPRLDGLALCRLLKSDPATQNVRVVIFSEIAALDSAQNAKNACADGFLSKPVEKTRLLGAIAQAIDPGRSTFI